MHFHGGASLLPKRTGYADVRLLRRRHVRVVQHFCGSDARLPDTERARNPWYVNSYGEDERENRARIARWADLTDGHVIFQDNSFDAFLRPAFSHIHIVPLAVDLQRLQPKPDQPPRDLPMVVHAPSNTGFKGTEVVRAAIERLNRGRRLCDYVEVTGRTHAETLDQLGRADVVIDQVRAGAYGTVTVEAMALGKPVICYILPELLPTYGHDFPVVSADPSTLEEVLRELMRSHDDRALIGARSRRYAERVHDHLKVAEAGRCLRRAAVNSRLRRLGQESAAYALVPASTALTSLILIPVTTRSFSPSDYGVLGLLLSLTTLLSIMVVLSLDSAAQRFYHLSDDEASRRGIFASWIWCPP